MTVPQGIVKLPRKVAFDRNYLLLMPPVARERKFTECDGAAVQLSMHCAAESDDRRHSRRIVATLAGDRWYRGRGEFPIADETRPDGVSVWDGYTWPAVAPCVCPEHGPLDVDSDAVAAERAASNRRRTGRFLRFSPKELALTGKHRR